MLMTDRERALVAEARVIELEAELAAYRANEDDDADEEAVALTEDGLRNLLRRLPRQVVRSRSVRLLRVMMARPGRPILYSRLNGGQLGDGTDADVAKVQVCYLRKALAGIGLADAITTIRGRGYVLEPGATRSLQAMLEQPNG